MTLVLKRYLSPNFCVISFSFLIQMLLLRDLNLSKRSILRTYILWILIDVQQTVPRITRIQGKSPFSSLFLSYTLILSLNIGVLSATMLPVVSAESLYWHYFTRKKKLQKKKKRVEEQILNKLFNKTGDFS